MIKKLFRLFFFSTIIFSQELEREFFSFKDGLPDNSIRQINQDKYGYIWVRTNSSIARFDGKKFSRIKQFDYKLFQEIIFLNDYIYIKDLNQIRRFSLSHQNKDLAKIDRTFRLKADKIFEAENNHSLYIYRNDSLFKFQEIENQLEYLNRIPNLSSYYSDQQQIVFSDNNAVYKKIDTVNQIILNKSASEIKQYNNKLVAISSGSVIDLETKKTIYSSKKDDLYINNSLMISFNNTRMKIWTNNGDQFEEELFSKITCIFYDKEETLYVGTDDGLFHFPNLKNLHFKHFNNVTSIAKSNEYLYLIIKHKKLFKINLITMKTDEVKIDNLDKFIYRVKNYNNTIYLLGSDYLYKDFKKVKKVGAFAALMQINKAVYLYDYNSKSLSILSGKSIPHFEKNLKDREIIEIIEQDLDIILRTSSGVFVFNKRAQTFKNIGALDNFIFYYNNENDNFHFKADSLIVTNNEHKTVFTTKDIFIPEIFAVGKPYKDSYLLSTNEGLFEYKDQNFFKRFCQLNGLIHQSSLKKVDNFHILNDKLYYFALSGLSVVSLDSIPKKELSLFINLISDGKAFNENESISYSHKLLQFDYQLITHRYERDVRYHYRILPFQKEWSTSRDNHVNFTHLSHGDYEFQIRAVNSERYEYLKSFRFKILKPFWYELWFILFVIITITLIIFYIIRRYSQYLSNEKEQLSSLVEERTAYLNDSNRLLQELNEELIDALLKRELLNKQLNDKITQMDDLLVVLNHDLVGPLRNILGMSNLLQKHIEKDDEKELIYKKLERIEANINTEMDIINDMLELSKYKSVRYSVTNVDCNQVVNEIQKLFEYELTKKNIALTITSPLPIILGERLRITQIFQNLIDNAIKYTEEKDVNQIEISHSYINEEHLFAIQDTGIGIPQDQITRIFYAFRRVKNTHVAKTSGKGIGLSAATSIIENYNGRIWVESVVSKGTTFYFTLSDLKNEFKGYNENE
jgi:signal transduction histidine kinase